MQFLISSCYWSSIRLYTPFFITVTQDHEWLSQIYSVHRSTQCSPWSASLLCNTKGWQLPVWGWNTQQWSHRDAPKMASPRSRGWVGSRAWLQEPPFAWWCPESPVGSGVEGTAHHWTHALVFFPLGIITLTLFKLPSDSTLTLWDTSQDLGKSTSCRLQ